MERTIVSWAEGSFRTTFCDRLQQHLHERLADALQEIDARPGEADSNPGKT